MKESAGNHQTHHRVVMLLENNPYSQDNRVKQEAVSLANAGYYVTVICPKPKNGKFYDEVADNIALFQYPAPPEGDGIMNYVWEYGYSMIMLFLVSLVVAVWKGFDVVHTHNPPDTMFPIGAFYKLFGKKFVFDHHDLAPENYFARFGDNSKPWLHKLLLLCERYTYRVADHVIATNESYKKVAQERGQKSPSEITIVRNGPNRERIRPVEPDPELRKRAGTLLGYVGIMGPQDGIDYLLRAMQKLIYDLDYRDVYVILMGKSGQINELRQYANDLGIGQNIEFSGWIDTKDLVRNLSTVDICLIPDPSNPFNDKCTMIKIMEYMAVGKPIVSFDLPEHRFSAQDAAVYAPNNDELQFAKLIVELMNDPEKRKAMGEFGLKRIDTTLAWRYQEKNLIHAYEKLLGVKQDTKTTLSERKLSAKNTPLM